MSENNSVVYKKDCMGFSSCGYFNSSKGVYELPKEFNTRTRKSFAKSLTDQSYYVPSKRAITGQDVSQSKIDSASYDFPNGKITRSLSDSMVDSRLPSLDIVEKVNLAKDSYKYAESLVQSDVSSALKSKKAKAAKDQLTEYTISQVVKQGNATNNSASNVTSK